MTVTVSRITGQSSVWLTFCSDWQQKEHQKSALLSLCEGKPPPPPPVNGGFPVQKDTLRWRHNDHEGVSNYQPHGFLLNRLFRRRSKKTSKLRVTGLCAGNSPGTGEFPAQRASDGPRWIPRTKGQWRGKCSHLMTSHEYRGLLMFPFDNVIMSHRRQTPSQTLNRGIAYGPW